MPFAREQQEEAALPHLDRMGLRGAAERPLSLRDVQQLVLVQDASAFLGKQITGGMVGRGIGLTGAHFLEPDRIHGRAPQQVVGTRDQVLQMDGVVHSFCQKGEYSPLTFLQK